jgi:queuine tRNA-ribosyltransferase
MLMTEHNLWFYQGLMSDLREAISGRRLATFAADFRDRYAAARAA